MLEHLGHDIRPINWSGDDINGVFQASCQNPNCIQLFILRRGLKNNSIYWWTNNGRNSFGFYEKDEYLQIKNEILLTVHKNMFCAYSAL